jgi:hypothetical protein
MELLVAKSMAIEPGWSMIDRLFWYFEINLAELPICFSLMKSRRP